MPRRKPVTPSRPPVTPLLLPRGVRHVLVFGGSFDPPHFYHTLAPLTVVGRVYDGDAWVLYVPAARSPHKRRGPFASDEHRLAMLALALDLPGPRSVWTDEIDRAAWARARGRVPAPSYMVDTLRRLRTLVPPRVRLRLLIGSDQVQHFHRWREPREVIRLAEPLVLVREPVVAVHQVVSSLDADFWTRSERREWAARVAPNFPMEPSSTGVRDHIPGAPKDAAKWEGREGLSSVITPVAEYIIAHNLYGFRKGPAVPATGRPGLPPGSLRLGRAERGDVQTKLLKAVMKAEAAGLWRDVALKRPARARNR